MPFSDISLRRRRSFFIMPHTTGDFDAFAVPAPELAVLSELEEVRYFQRCGVRRGGDGSPRGVVSARSGIQGFVLTRA